MFVLVFSCIAPSALADCPALADGIYVADADADADALVDGGQWSRVLDQLTQSSLAKKFRATTFQFSNSIVVSEGKARIYRLISNAPDSRYEALSIEAAADVTSMCKDLFKFEFQVDAFYPNEITLGVPPSKASSKLKHPIKIRQEVRTQPGGQLQITSCQAQELRKSGWRETRDDLGLCNGTRKGYALFNIRQAIRSNVDWRALDSALKSEIGIRESR